MALFQLDHDEAIILRSDTAERYGATEEEFEDEELQEVFLTNKRLIYIVDTSTGIFSKSKPSVIKRPLQTLKIINGVPQIKQIKHSFYGHCLQFQFAEGLEYLSFSKKACTQWMAELTRLFSSVRKPVADEPTPTQVSAVTAMPITSQATAQPAHSASEASVISEKKHIYCTNCGEKLSAGSKFCNNCGIPTTNAVPPQTSPTNKQHAPVTPPVPPTPPTPSTEQASTQSSFKRKTVYEGEVHKCPNCGEVLKAFEVTCPACGIELRGTKASSSVKEFALKLEAIEARREYEKPRGLFAAMDAQQRISKTDEQKISLIKSFSVPNSKEDLLEFMILATSSMNMHTYDSTNTNISKSEKAVNAAWLSKVHQIYKKAKFISVTDSTFIEINSLYNNCINEIRKTKRNGIIKWALLFGFAPLLLILVIVPLIVFGPDMEAKEIERLENIVVDVQSALDNGEFKHALRIADTIDYQRYDVEMERKWDIQRAYWVEKVLEEAEKNGITLDYTPTQDIDKANDKSIDKNSSSGFIEGVQKGLQQGSDDSK